MSVLFVCEDNKYAATRRTELLTDGPGPVARAKSLGLPPQDVDGNNIVKLDTLVGDSVAQMRNGDGPKFLHAETCLHMGHTVVDPVACRPATEVKEAKVHYPIEQAKVYLTENGIDRADLTEIKENSETKMIRAFENARDTAWPDPATASSDVQDLGAPI